MIFPHCPFIQAESGFQRKSNVFVDIRGADSVFGVVRTMFAGIVQVLKYLGGDEFSAVASFVQCILVRRVNGSVIPWHSTESLHLGEIEHCPEETSDSLIMVEYSVRGGSLAHIVEVIVDGAERRPVRRGPVRSVLCRIVVHKICGLAIPGVGISVLVPVNEALDGCGKTSDEAVGVYLQRGFVLEIESALYLVGVLLREK